MSVRSMLFVRKYPYFLGGHLKVFDYLAHVAASGLFEPRLYLAPGSIDPGPSLVADTIERTATLVEADAYFVAGFNWNMLDQAGIDTTQKPVVNLVQSMLHTKPEDPRYSFLGRPALRICVSSAIAEAVAAIPHVSGPIVAIPNGIDLTYLAQFATVEKDDRIFIAGAKNGMMAQDVANMLSARGVAVDLCIELVPRDAFLARMASCTVAIVLPHPDEGFLLPALEAMALGTTIVIPHTVGPASYCIDGKTCFATEYSAEALCAGAMRLREDQELRARLRRAGLREAAAHSLADERRRFIEVLREYVAAQDQSESARS